MIPFKLGPLRFSLPQSYDELTFDQFLKLRKSSGDILEVLSILSGQPIEAWSKMKDVDLDIKLLPVISFLNENRSFSDYPLPDKIKIGEEFYSLPDIKQKTFGQKLALQREVQLINETTKDEFDLMPFAIALYFQPEVTKSEFNEKKVEELIPLVLQCKIYEVIPVATFFLTSWEKSLNKSRRIYLQGQVAKKSEQVSKPSISSEHLARFTPLRRHLIKLLMKFYSWITVLSISRSGMKKRSQDINEG